MNKQGIKSILEDKKGQSSLMSLPVNLLMLFIAITFLVALIPAFVEMQNMAQEQENLNCHGYVAYTSTGAVDTVRSANDSRASNSTIGCMAIKLYLPYIVLGVLIAGVAMIFYGRTMGGQQQQMGGY